MLASRPWDYLTGLGDKYLKYQANITNSLIVTSELNLTIHKCLIHFSLVEIHKVVGREQFTLSALEKQYNCPSLGGESRCTGTQYRPTHSRKNQTLKSETCFRAPLCMKSCLSFQMKEADIVPRLQCRLGWKLSNHSFIQRSQLFF